MTSKINKTFIIRHKETQEQWEARSGKSSWKESGHAKNAWAMSDHKNTKGIIPLLRENRYRKWYEYPKFDEQDVYEVIELKPESEEKFKQALLLLEDLFEVCPQDYLIENDLDIRINSFFAGLGENIDE